MLDRAARSKCADAGLSIGRMPASPMPWWPQSACPWPLCLVCNNGAAITNAASGEALKTLHSSLPLKPGAA